MSRNIRVHAVKVTHHPAVDMVPTGVAVLFETFQFGLIAKGLVAVVALMVIAFHYTKRH